MERGKKNKEGGKHVAYTTLSLRYIYVESSGRFPFTSRCQPHQALWSPPSIMTQSAIHLAPTQPPPPAHRSFSSPPSLACAPPPFFENPVRVTSRRLLMDVRRVRRRCRRPTNRVERSVGRESKIGESRYRGVIFEFVKGKEREKKKEFSSACAEKIPLVNGSTK